MIERDFVKQKKKEFQIQEFVVKNLSNVGHSKTRMQRTPLGEKIIVFASRPGLVVGREGKNIKKLTTALKKKFNLENPQIEISEVENINLDANIVSERIASSLERFGIGKFKGVGHKVMSDVMGAGALGIEIIISGKVPSSRARSWRFYQGYLKKCGDIALTGVDTAYATAKLKSGVVGIQVRIMPPETKLPDHVELIEEKEEVVEELTPEEAQEAVISTKSDSSKQSKGPTTPKSDSLPKEKKGKSKKEVKQEEQSSSVKPKAKKEEASKEKKKEEVKEESKEK